MAKIVFDTAVKEIGDVFNVSKRLDPNYLLLRRAQLQFSLSKDDVVVLEGRVEDTLPFGTILTVDQATDVDANNQLITSVDLPRDCRVSRTVIGLGLATVWVDI